jgi:hypothetical protein
MPELHELVEHIEHARGGGHGEHGGAHGPGKAIGITMAILGVMLALCAAMVGAARTELIATMVEQSNRFSLYQAESMKLRVMEADVEMLHAITPSKAEVVKFERALKEVRRVSGKADDEDTQELKAAIELSTKELADVLSPDPEDESHLKLLAKRYEHDMKEAKEDAECYDDKIQAHFESAEWYERAQLCAEIGIVVASVALLLGSRPIWYVALVFGACCAGIIGRTYMHTSTALTMAEQKIAEAQKRTEAIEEDEGRTEPPAKPLPGAEHVDEANSGSSAAGTSSSPSSSAPSGPTVPPRPASSTDTK